MSQTDARSYSIEGVGESIAEQVTLEAKMLLHKEMESILSDAHDRLQDRLRDVIRKFTFRIAESISVGDGGRELTIIVDFKQLRLKDV